MKKSFKILTTVLIGVVVLSMTGCGSNKKDSAADTKTTQAETTAAEVKTSTSTMEDLVTYFKQKGYIGADAKPVDINATKGYLTVNSPDFTKTAIADKALDYNGIWLFWWDQKNQSELYPNYQFIKVNSGMIVLDGGAAILQSEASSGSFAIAFSKDFAKKDAVLADFKALAE